MDPTSMFLLVIALVLFLYVLYDKDLRGFFTHIIVLILITISFIENMWGVGITVWIAHSFITYPGFKNMEYERK